MSYHIPSRLMRQSQRFVKVKGRYQMVQRREWWGYRGPAYVGLVLDRLGAQCKLWLCVPDQEPRLMASWE